MVKAIFLKVEFLEFHLKLRFLKIPSSIYKAEIQGGFWILIALLDNLIHRLLAILTIPI